MKRAEKMEIAYAVYSRHGGRNLNDAAAALQREHGISVTAQTLYRWARQGGWQERLKGPSRKEAILYDILDLIERLKHRLKAAPAIDAQAVYAYTNLVSAFFNASKSVPMRKDPEEMKRVAEDILQNEYGITR